MSSFMLDLFDVSFSSLQGGAIIEITHNHWTAFIVKAILGDFSRVVFVLLRKRNVETLCGGGVPTFIQC